MQSISITPDTMILKRSNTIERRHLVWSLLQHALPQKVIQCTSSNGTMRCTSSPGLLGALRVQQSWSISQALKQIAVCLFCSCKTLLKPHLTWGLVPPLLKPCTRKQWDRVEASAIDFSQKRTRGNAALGISDKNHTLQKQTCGNAALGASDKSHTIQVRQNTRHVLDPLPVLLLASLLLLPGAPVSSQVLDVIACWRDVHNATVLLPGTPVSCQVLRPPAKLSMSCASWKDARMCITGITECCCHAAKLHATSKSRAGCLEA
eukprot:1161603-Pelagomonas_calceolata.AAC.14